MVCPAMKRAQCDAYEFAGRLSHRTTQCGQQPSHQKSLSVDVISCETAVQKCRSQAVADYPIQLQGSKHVVALAILSENLVLEGLNGSSVIWPQRGQSLARAQAPGDRTDLSRIAGPAKILHRNLFVGASSSWPFHPLLEEVG